MFRLIATTIAALILIMTFTASIMAEQVAYPPQKYSNDGYGIPPLTKNKNYMSGYEPPFMIGLLNTGQIRATYVNNGTFGTAYLANPDCGELPCPGFVTPAYDIGGDYTEYLFAGAVWVGGIVGDDTLVSVGADGWFPVMEFFPDDSIYNFDGPVNQSLWAHFTDTITDPDLTDFDPYDNRYHLPINLRIANRAYIWYSDPPALDAEHYSIIYDMVITNIGDQPIQDGYAALYFDADVAKHSEQYGGFTDDLTGSLRDHGIAYIIDNDGDPFEGAYDEISPTRLFAFRFLNISFNAPDTGYNWWISNGNPSLDFGPQPLDEDSNLQCYFGEHTGTPTGDPGKYCMISKNNWDYDQIKSDDSIPGWTRPNLFQAIDFANGYDTRFLMSIGPFDLAPDSSVRILYTTLTGDSVHHDPSNFINNFGDDSAFLANLDFSDVINNAATAETMAQFLVNPLHPPVGLRIIANSDDSVTIEWDPYGFDEVDDYEVFLYKIPPDSLPYPDIVPPWLELQDLSIMESVDNTDKYYQYVFDTLQQGHFYYAGVANVTDARATGDKCDPVLIYPGGRINVPEIRDKYIFVEQGNLAEIFWEEPAGVDVDHYNIYKKLLSDTLPGLFYPRYDTGQFAATVPPIDSFYRNDRWFYYYAMEPYAQTDSGITYLGDIPEDSSIYVVTAVDDYGHESSFSDTVYVYVLDNFAPRDILVMNCRQGTMQVDRVLCDSLIAFYDYVLSTNYGYYSFPDSLDAYGGYTKPDWWRDLIPYDLVIIDGGLGLDVITDNAPFLNSVDGLEKYIYSGGKLAYFGSFCGIRGEHIQEPPDYYPLDDNWFITDYFGVDSVFHTGLMYYFNNDISVDSLIGLTAANPVWPGIPYITYNPINNALGSLSSVWPAGTAPTPSTFKVNNMGRTIYRVETDYPDQSLIENHSLGVKSYPGHGATYLFGFHLWYMDPAQAALLIDYLMADTPDPEPAYLCGNANGDDKVNVGDAVFVINYVFRDGAPPDPLIAGDANGDGITNVGDAVYLINYVFRGGPPPQCK